MNHENIENSRHINEFIVDNKYKYFFIFSHAEETALEKYYYKYQYIKLVIENLGYWFKTLRLLWYKRIPPFCKKRSK